MRRHRKLEKGKLLLGEEKFFKKEKVKNQDLESIGGKL